MGLRFRKSVKICKGVRVNFGKTGASLSVGTKGGRYTMHTSGKKTVSVGIPGSGLYYTQSSGGGMHKHASTSPAKEQPKTNQGTSPQNNQPLPPKKRISIWKILLGLLFFPIALTIIIVKNKKIKPVMKIVLLVIFWIFFLVVGIVNSEETTATESTDNIPGAVIETTASANDSSTDDETEKNTAATERDKFTNLNLFIETYNKIATTPIADTFEIDISAGGEYYRSEFRLSSFKNAPALKGKIGAGSVEMINSNYGGIFGSDLRIYAFVDSLNATTDIFESYCKACDPDITKEDFDEFYEYHKLDAGDCRIAIGDISGYVMVKDGGFDILLDSTPDYFDQ